nr:Oxa1 [Starmerella bombicola]
MLSRRIGLSAKFVSRSFPSSQKVLLPSHARILGQPALYGALSGLGVRHKSEIASEIGKVSDAAAEAVQNVAAQVPQIPADQIGYFQSVGLAQSWVWPEGIFQHLLEYINVYSGMPWWATIMVVALTARTCMLPLYLSSSDAAAKMARIKPELTVLMEKTKQATDQREIQQAMVQRRKLMQDNNIKVLNMAKPLLSVPVFLGFFNALRGMSNVPVEGFTTQGLAWFQNLSAVDPYCGLQIITATLYAATFKFFGGETGAAQVSPVMKKVFTYMPFVAVPLTMALPSSVCFYFAINSVFSVIQSNVLKSPTLRKKLGLAPMVSPEEQAEINKRMGIDTASASNDSIVAALRKKYQDAKDQAERKVAEEERKKLAEANAKLESESRYIQIRKRPNQK